jgi:hypothetical protein
MSCIINKKDESINITIIDKNTGKKLSVPFEVQFELKQIDSFGLNYEYYFIYEYYKKNWEKIIDLFLKDTRYGMNFIYDKFRNIQNNQYNKINHYDGCIVNFELRHKIRNIRKYKDNHYKIHYETTYEMDENNCYIPMSTYNMAYFKINGEIPGKSQLREYKYGNFGNINIDISLINIYKNMILILH